MAQTITVESTINASMEKVWTYYTDPKQVVKWNTPSQDWHTPKAHTDLRVGGTFSYRMEAKDGSAGFDFEGVYTEVQKHASIGYTIGDGRTVKTTFKEHNGGIRVTVVFEAETENSIEMQRAGWQAILDNFKKHVETH